MSGDWVRAVILGVVALSAVTAIVLRGPIGKALAQWISGWNHNEAKWMELKAAKDGMPLGEVEQLRAEVDDLRRQLAEVHERLDFAERILAKGRGADRIGSGA